MFSIPKQFSAATKNEFSSQLAAFNTLASKSMEALEKFVSVNLEAAKATREDSMSAAKKILSAQTPQQFYAAASERLAANVQMIQSYARHMAEVSAGTQAEFIKIAQVQKAEADKVIPVAAPMANIDLTNSAVKPALVPQSANDEPIAEATLEVEPVTVNVAEIEPAANPAPEVTVPTKPVGEIAAKEPASSKPRAKAALAKSSVTSSFPNPAVKSLVKKPAAKPSSAKTPVANKKLTKPSAKKKA